ncbi:GNAT family N-acetyltransferase [Phormidium sp. FACHB-592]|uniref:GNAT family N-acetyltransferase n=1 Tax=Stenomitos frigidus AS-A4 TaxID=2933935 RepID=A0ABV0KUB0_9CYAN|nr:GNAT family N-acetyltransferase [Phormidium sp. FACHB-592]MBD2073054.1 GNAT family N-acetyltransferase [Phormidium sp. FACHB-592]
MEDVIKLRLATPEDYGFLYALHGITMHDYIEVTWGWGEVWQQSYFKQHFRPEANQIIVLHGHEIGHVEVDDKKDRVHIGNIQILPEHQSKGIGSLIILKIIRQAQRQEQPVTLQVLKVNPARRLYKRLGFVVEGEDDAHFKMKRALTHQ